MPDYSQGKIYKITWDNEFYIGSTVMSLKKRLWHHKNTISGCIDKQGKDIKITLIEAYPCDTSQQLRMREQYWIERNPGHYNKYKAYQSREDRVKYKSENDRARYVKNREKILSKKHFVNSFGGDPRFHNNLLQISLCLFQ